MTRRGAGIGVVLAAVLMAGCGAMTRHRALSFLFDGVPYPSVAVPAGEQPAAGSDAALARSMGYREHGPYAARMCGACHDSAATNALVVPADRLCSQCHDINLNRKVVHGPLAAGGCLVCHDPHGSKHRFLLVSESDSFCLRCHDAGAIARIPGHQDTSRACTGCHDAHMSDRPFLLR